MLWPIINEATPSSFRLGLLLLLGLVWFYGAIREEGAMVEEMLP